MSNPIFEALSKTSMQNNSMIEQFQQFKKQMSGKNPTEEINKLLRSGSITQQQLNQAQQMAQQLQTMFRQ